MNKKTILKYVIPFAIGLVVFVLGVFSQGLFRQESLVEIYGCLSDCFLFPGVLLGGIGALTWISGEGGFDMITYAVGFTVERLLHPRKAYESYYQYKIRRIEKQKPWLKESFFVGLGFFVLSIVFLLLYLASE